MKILKNKGDVSDIHPETQESDGEFSFEEESTEKSYVYQFKWISRMLRFDYFALFHYIITR